MGVSFHQAGRRFEGRESATTNLRISSRRAAEPRLNAVFRNPPGRKFAYRAKREAGTDASLGRD